MTDLSTCTLESLREDEEYALYRGRSDAVPHKILVVAPVSERPKLETLKRLEHEYALRTDLDPACTVPPLALIRHQGRTVLVFEDPGGDPLNLELGQTLALTRCLRIAIAAVTALKGVHQHGIIHRDIKPSNIMVDPRSDRVWLTGFGTASRQPECQAPASAERLVGTWEYMAPELTGRLNRSIDSRSDLYSFGATLYEMLIGTPPFTASTPVEWIHCHVARYPVPPRTRRAEIPETLSAIVMKLLAKNPDERYQTAAGLMVDLKRCLEDLESLGSISPFIPGRHDVPDRLLIPKKLYGRHREREVLLEALTQVATRGALEFVMVSGYSGMGKTSLVNELHQAVRPLRAIFVSGKFDQYKRNIPYACLAQATQSLIRNILEKDESEVASWRDMLLRALGSNGQLIAELIPELELVIGKQPPVLELSGQEAEIRFRTVFRTFLGVFARSEHPLVLFLDDLQWVDTATLKLVEHLVTHGDLRYLLLIGAYRDNEVSPTHPLMLTLDGIRRVGRVVHHITLSPLSRDDIDELVAESVRQECKLARSLGLLVYEKTAGNPFFTIQFLTALAEDRLIEFDVRKSAWHWDLERIGARPISDNVVDLLIAKLMHLPHPAIEALKQLACLGCGATSETLSILLGRSEGDVHSALREPVREELVNYSDGSYDFVHDRVQEAIYSLIPKTERPAAHLRTARVLLLHTASDQLNEKIFEIVKHFDPGSELIATPEEREQVAELNLIAGKRAQAAAAYAAAHTYFTNGCALLAEDSWERRYRLIFDLEVHRAESEFVTGDLERAEERLSMLSRHAANLVDRSTLTCLRLDLYTTLNRSDLAVEACLEYLHQQLGVEWSPHPKQEEVLQEYERLWCQLGTRPIETLLKLPLMEDPQWRATMDVLTRVMPAAMFTDNNLQRLVLGRMANISLQHGNCDGSCLGYVWLGGVLGTFFGDYQSGFRFGKLAVDLMESRGLNYFKARVYLGFGSLVNFWTRHLRSGLIFMRRAFDAACERGDLTYAAYACYDLIGHLLPSGDPLHEVQREAEDALDFALKARFGLIVDGIMGQLRLIRMLRGLTPQFGSYSDSDFDELKFEDHLENDPQLANAACRYWIRKLQAKFFAADYASAVNAAAKAQQLLWAVPPALEIPDYHFYAALARANVYATAPTEERMQHLEALQLHRAQLATWAENCPDNFGDRAALVSAELARINGPEVEAERHYEEAIRLAREHGFIQNEGVANEVAGRFYLERGLNTIGHACLSNARSCYLRWGARGKARQLDRLYPGLDGHAPPSGTTPAGTSSMEELDFATVVRALQVVSREIDLKKLVETLMSIALEHSGAERGLLFLCRGSQHEVGAEARTRGDSVEVILGQLEVSSAFPETVLRSVIRTLETVLLDDAAAADRFSDDAYIHLSRPRSVLCLPLVKGRELTGVLYLENNLASGVFTSDRLAVLELLASQAAISLTNAQLYADLQLENSERRKAEEEREKAEKGLRHSSDALNQMREELRQASRVAVMGELTASLAHELNQPLGGILSNAQAARRLLAERRPDLAEVKAAVEDIIDDNSRAVETIQNVRTLFQPHDSNMSSVDLKQILLDVARLLAAEAKQKNVNLRLNLPSALPKVTGNKTHLLQVMMNLVRNAFDAVCMDGVESREVEVRAQQPEPERVHVVVSDSGNRIDPEIMPRLFDAFFTTKPDGMGLGLAITRRIIENHGGRLWVTPNPDRGVTLEFELPVSSDV